MVRRADAHSLAVDVYQRLRSAILNGRYEAGERLLPAELSAQYGVSPTVVREALMRLTEQRLAISTPNRGHHVVTMTLDDMHDLVEFRVIAETAALRLAVDRGDIAWEGSVISALHQLNATDPSFAPEDWFDAHLAFHKSLLSACGNDRLRHTCEGLLEVGDLYLRWSGYRVASHSVAAGSGTVSPRDVVAEHTGILEAALARDADLAAARYQAHLRLTEQLAARSTANEAARVRTSAQTSADLGK